MDINKFMKSFFKHSGLVLLCSLVTFFTFSLFLGLPIVIIDYVLMNFFNTGIEWKIMERFEPSVFNPILYIYLWVYVYVWDYYNGREGSTFSDR